MIRLAPALVVNAMAACLSTVSLVMVGRIAANITIMHITTQTSVGTMGTNATFTEYQSGTVLPEPILSSTAIHPNL